MPLPPVQFASFKAGAGTVLTPGADPDTDLVPLVPLTEPGTVGPPPAEAGGAPDLILRVDGPAAWPVSRVRCGSGHLVTAPLDASTSRPRTTGWRLVWSALTQEQKAAHEAWLVQEVGVSQQAMSIEVDGEGAGGATVIPMRPTERARYTWLGPRQGGAGSGGGGGVWKCEVACEEVV